MKFLASQVIAVVREPGLRRNADAFLKYLAVLGAVIALHTVLFHVLMVYEGQDHSWLTGLYWTLTVMSTLGFGDITFHTDLGRVFTMVVLVSGIVLLLIVLPFAFIRHFYAPWLEAQLRLKAPRELPEDTRDHVIICRLDDMARTLIEDLDVRDIPYVVLEPEPETAVSLFSDGMRVVVGRYDAVATWRALRAESAGIIVANLDDASNTNATLTIREVAPEAPILALVEDKDAADILELAGATHVIPLKHRLGQQLASRVSAGDVGMHEVGRIETLSLAEFPVHNTQLVGKPIRETRLRELTGLNIVAYWDRENLLPARPDAVLPDYSVVVVVGTDAQMNELRAMLSIYQQTERPVLVIGGGKVGRAVIRSLKARGVGVTVIEENESLRPLLEKTAERVVTGDAANIEIMKSAGIDMAPSVVITTRDDATNIYLAVYARRLNPNAYILSRIKHDRNLIAMYRAGANTVLGESMLGAQFVLSILLKRDLILLGEEVEAFVIPVPKSLSEKTLAESEIGVKTGLNVVAVDTDGGAMVQAAAPTRLVVGRKMVLLGTNEQRQAFARFYEKSA